MNLEFISAKKNKIRGKKRRLNLSLEKSPFFYLLPTLIFLGAMVGFPILRVFYLSLTQNILTRPDLGVSFIGFGNYIDLFSSVDFWKTIGRTLAWVLLSVGGKCLIGFIIAWLLSKEIGFKRFYILLLMIPWVTPMVVAAVTWKWIFNGENGMLNWILMEFHLLTDQFSWLGHGSSAFVATAIVDMWIGIPFMAMVFLAGLQSVPTELTEAASIDGATPYHRLRYIILPLMKPIILVSTTLSTIWTLNSFGVIWPMTKGGPVTATQTLVIEAYKQSFGAFDLGKGAAIAVIIFVILLSFTIIYKRFLMKQEEF